MKKIAITLIIFAFVVTSVFAGPVYSASGAPKGGEPSSVDVSFYYDADLMQRLTFGFTETSFIDWNSDNGNLNNSVLNLNSQVKPGVGELARGKGEINFYWVLRTDKAVTAKLYLEAPMKERSSDLLLDWKLSFDSSLDDVINHDVVIDSTYGMDYAVPIYSRNQSDEISVLTGYLPVQIFTDYTPIKMEDQVFTGSVGVIVETN